VGRAHTRFWTCFVNFLPELYGIRNKFVEATSMYTTVRTCSWALAALCISSRATKGAQEAPAALCRHGTMLCVQHVW
jgi:hypothetical protein